MNTLILLVGDHRQPGRERTMQLGCLTVILLLLCMVLNSEHVAKGVSHVRDSMGSLLSVTSYVLILLGGGTTAWWWATGSRRSGHRPTDGTLKHAVDGAPLIKEELVRMLRQWHPGIHQWANRDRIYFKVHAQAEPFIRVFFNAGDAATDVFCTIENKDVLKHLAARFPGARLATGKFGNVLIPIQGSAQLSSFAALFKTALMEAKKRR